MDDQSTPEDDSPAPAVEASNPRMHRWASNESNFDIAAAKPHACMSDIVQRGNYLHCNTGNHGMRIPAGKILIQTPEGAFDLVDMVVLGQ